MTIYPALSKIGSGLSRNLAGSDFIAAIRAARKDKLGVLADAKLEISFVLADAKLETLSHRATRFVRSLFSMINSRRGRY